MINLGYIKCPHCQSLISKLANKCPKCHEILNRDEINNIVEKEKSKDKLLNLGCLGFLIGYFLSAFFLIQLFRISFVSTMVISIIAGLFVSLIITKK